MWTQDKAFRVGSAVTIAIFTLLCVLLWVLPGNRGAALTAEGALIESCSLAVIAIGVLVASVRTCRARSLMWVSITMLFLWMFLRELDFQKLFTYRSVESIGFYSSPKASLGTKAIALAALLPFGLAGLYFGVQLVKSARNGRSFWLTWRFPAIAAAILIGAASVSEKVLEGRFQIVEECAELAFVFLLVFVAIFARSTRDMVAAPAVNGATP